MAKKTEEVDATPIETKLEVETKVTKDDVVAIAVSREEERLQQENDSLKKQIHAKEKEYGNNQKEHEKAILKLGESKFKQAMDDAAAGLKKAGVAARGFVNTYHHEADKQTVTYYIGICGDGEKSDKAEVFGDGFGMYRTIPKSTQIKALEKKNEDISNETNTLRDNLLKTKKQLSRLSSVERKARATIAENLLQGSKEGRRLLDSISGVKSLPLPK